LNTLYQRLKILLVACGLIAAASFELRLMASAFLLRHPGIDSALEAARLTPADEHIYLQLADLDPNHRAVYLRKASALNPRDARPWLDRGFIAEANGDADEAGVDFREAARLDRRVAPAWALANFYFRQGNMSGFYSWGYKYRALAGGNAVGLYRLAWNRDPQVSNLMKAFNPLTCKELEGMAFFLAGHAPPADLAQVDQLLSACPGEEAANVVMSDVSRLLMTDHPDIALRLWTSMKHESLPSGSLTPPAGQILTNGEFANRSDTLGFNWTMNQTPGIRVRTLSQPHSVEFFFDGSEPEVSTLLFQPVVLAAGNTYRLDCRVDSETQHETGFSWRLVELSTGKTLENGAGNVTNRQSNSLSWAFQAPRTARTLVLAFTYVRPAGETKKYGKVLLSDITLTQSSN
jgi:hypothetical protein